MRASFITMENPMTGEIRQVKIGLAWDCLFSVILTYSPFFYRRIYKWAVISFMVFIAVYGLLYPPPDTDTDSLLQENTENYALAFTLAVLFIFNIFFLLKGNILTAQNYYRSGFKVIDDNKKIIALAQKKFKLPQDAFAANEPEDKRKLFSKLAGNR